MERRIGFGEKRRLEKTSPPFSVLLQVVSDAQLLTSIRIGESAPGPRAENNRRGPLSGSVLALLGRVVLHVLG